MCIIYLSISQSVCLSVYLFMYLSIDPSIYLYISAILCLSSCCTYHALLRSPNVICATWHLRAIHCTTARSMQMHAAWLVATLSRLNAAASGLDVTCRGCVAWGCCPNLKQISQNCREVSALVDLEQKGRQRKIFFDGGDWLPETIKIRNRWSNRSTEQNSSKTSNKYINLMSDGQTTQTTMHDLDACMSRAILCNEALDLKTIPLHRQKTRAPDFH